MTETSVDPSSFKPFEVTAVHLVYVGLGFFIVLFGMFSLFIKERLYLGEAPLAAVFGIIVGPAALNLFNPSHWANNGSGAPGGHITDEISLEVLRVTIALSVFAVGVELPKKYLLRHWRSIIFLLGPVMIWGWLITALFMYALVPGLDFLNSLVVASCVTPTDPILAQAVVGGPWAEKHVPAHLRHILMCESGCNDGAAFPFLYLALFLTLHRDNRGKAIAEWFYDALAYQIIFGTLLGALIGWAARKLMRFSERHKLVDRESFVAQYVSLAIASMGVNVLLGSDDLLAAFACGTAFAWDGWFTKQTEDSNFSSIVDLLFNVAVFVYIGALMPFRDWAGGTADEPNTLNIWRLFVLAICVLLTKRIPIVIALWKWIPDIKTFREAVFAGHFGPIGVGAIFIATLARTELPEEIPSPPETSNDVLALVVQPIIYFFVICSITIHGLTIPFFAFSKNATRMTRTWSRNPSFGKFDAEPGWVSRMRKRTGEDLKEEEGGMSEIERVLNAQLRQIGKGAIGGEDEKELARMETNGGSGSGSGYGLPTRSAQSSSSSGADAINPQAKVQFDADYIDEEGHDDVVGDEWGGDDTIEMRRYREKQKAKKETEYAKLRQRQQEHDEDLRKSQDEKQHDSEKGDLGGAEMMDEERGAMDRDIPKSRSEKRHEEEEEEEEEREDSEKRKKEKGLFSHLQSSGSSSSSTKQELEHEKIRQECEEHYPKSRSWTEGNVLIIEYQKSKLSEVECHKLPILEHEKDAIVGQDDPAHAWALQHADGLQFYAGLEDANNWSPSEAVHHLVLNRIPKKYSEIMARRKKRRNSDAESKEQQDARFNALYGGMTYASERRHDEDENDYKRSYEENDDRVGVQGKARTSSHKKAVKQHRERTPSPPVTGWLAPRVEDIARQKQLKASRRRGGRATSPKGSMSPPGSASPTGFSDIFGQRQGPKEYKCSSEARRRNMKKKLMAGKISLCPNAGEEGETNEEIVESPTSFSGLGVPRTSSAGGLGQSSSSQSSGRRTMLNSNSGSNALLSIPRTFTNSSQDSNSINNRSMAQFVPGIRANHDHSRSSSVQWLDINDESHDHRSSRRNMLSGTDHSSTQSTSSPNRLNKVDLARIGGGISRPSSGQGHRLQNQMSISGANTPEEKKDDGDDQQSVYASSSNSKQTQKKRSRFGTLLSSIASGSSPTSAFERARQQSPQQIERPSTAPTGSSNEGNALAPSSPTIIVGAGEYPGGDGGGGILTDGNASVYSGSGAETPKKQQNQQSSSQQQQQQQQQQHQQNVDSPAERGVTFEF